MSECYIEKMTITMQISPTGAVSEYVLHGGPEAHVEITTDDDGNPTFKAVGFTKSREIGA